MTNRKTPFTIASDLTDAGHFQEAIPIWKKIVKNEPKKISAWLVYGLSLKLLGNYPEAIRVFKKGIKLRPPHVSNRPLSAVYSNLGWSQLACNKPAAALKSFDKAISLCPFFAITWYGKALALEKLPAIFENEFLARQCFSLACKLDPQKRRNKKIYALTKRNTKRKKAKK